MAKTPSIGAPSSKCDSSVQSFRVLAMAPSIGHRNAFFETARRNARQQQRNPARCDVEVPALVFPNLAERERLHRAPRTELLTLPSIGNVRKPAAGVSIGSAATARANSFRKVHNEIQLPQLRPHVPPVEATVHPFSARQSSTFADPPTAALASPPPLQSPRGPRASRSLSRSAKLHDGDNNNNNAGSDSPIESEDVSPQQHIAAFESTGPRQPGESSYRHVTTIDEEASARVLKVMFQLGLTKNSAIIAKLRELEPEVLQKRVLQEVGHKKQMSREEFFAMLRKVLRDDYISRRDSNTLFSVFDEDKSGMVDAVEFVGGFTSLVTSGVDDVAFKFLAMLMEGREKSTMNAFLSRFELSILIEAAQNFYKDDAEIVGILAELPSRFDFSHHMGRTPVALFRKVLREDDDLRVIFENLPNPSKAMRDLPALSATLALQAQESNTSWMSSLQLVADQFLNQNIDAQRSARETDSPKWFSMAGVVYKSSATHPYPEPVFLRDQAAGKGVK